MPRPRSESEYLARLLPPSVAAAGLSRRGFLKGTLGAGAAVSLSSILAACGGGATAAARAAAPPRRSPSAPTSPTPCPRRPTPTCWPRRGTVKVNTVDHENFQENINNYLQGNPDDVFTWFAGYRTRFFAAQGLVGDISDVYGGLSGFSEAFKQASTGDDGKQYFVPLTTYPWALFYRKSVWEEKGYQPPRPSTSWSPWPSRCRRTASSDRLRRQGRLAGHGHLRPAQPAHQRLPVPHRPDGRQAGLGLAPGQAGVRNLAELLPYHQEDALGREWQEAAQSLLKKESGMYLLGMFVGQQFPGKEQEDLDFFAFPEIDPAVGTGAIEAPIDGFMMSAEPKNEAGAKELLKYLGTAKAEDIALKADPTVIGASSEADTSSYTALQKKAVEFIGSAESIAQFLDRDTRPDFAATVMLPGIQTFLKKPDDIDGLTKSLESQKKSIFTS